MLKELCPTEYVIDDCLFVWEDLIENQKNGEYKRKLITKFNEVFGLKWHLEDGKAKEDIDLNNNNLIRFQFNNVQLNIYYRDQKNLIVILLDHEEKNKNKQRNADLYIFERVKNSLEIKGSHRLLTERHKNKTSVYALKHNSITTRYLEVTLKPNIEKLMLDKRKHAIDTTSEIRKQRGDYSPPKISGIGLAEYFPDIKEMQENREN